MTVVVCLNATFRCTCLLGAEKDTLRCDFDFSVTYGNLISARKKHTLVIIHTGVRPLDVTSPNKHRFCYTYVAYAPSE